MAKQTASKENSKKTTKKAPKQAKGKKKKANGKKKGSDAWQETILKKVVQIGKKAPSLSSKPEEEVVAEFRAILELEFEKFPREKYPKRSDRVYWKRAFAKFRNKHKKLLRSPAIYYWGKILGCKESRDMMGKMREESLTLADSNLDKALRDGVIMFEKYTDADTGEVKKKPQLDEHGQYIPRDTRKTFPRAKNPDGSPKKNPGFGEELKSSWTRTVFLVSAPEDDSGPVRKTTFELRGTKAMPEIGIKVPRMGTNVRFLALNRTPEYDEDTPEEEILWVLRSSSQTEFEILPEDQLPPLSQLFKSDVLKGWTAEPDELEDYHDENATNDDGSVNWDEFVLTRGDVVQLSLEPTKSGNLWLRFEKTTIDEDIDELDDGFGELDDEDIPDSTTAWIPPHLKESLDFGEDSLVYIGGRTGRMEARDENGNPIKDEDTDEPVYDPVNVSAYGLWADPEFKELPMTTEMDGMDSQEVGGEEFEADGDYEEYEETNGSDESKGENEEGEEWEDE